MLTVNWNEICDLSLNFIESTQPISFLETLKAKKNIDNNV